MGNLRFIVWLFTCALLTGCPESSGTTSASATRTPTRTIEAEASQGVRLRAEKPAGVPVHPAEGSRKVSGRIATGTVVKVLSRAEQGRWLEVQAPNGVKGWVTRRYVDKPGAKPAASAARVQPRSPWTSRKACLERLASGQRPKRVGQKLRIASWNVRWFPDGTPGKAKQPTDLIWLACAIAYLDVDVVALQEIKQNPRAVRALDRVRKDLAIHIPGSTWQAFMDPCPGADRQHVGLLVNTKVVAVKAQAAVPELNPKGGCAGRLRPGYGAHLTHAASGLDLHLISVHLKSGPNERSMKLRQRSLDAFDRSFKSRQAKHADTDMVVFGDFNTMGCKDCEPKVSGPAEIAALEAKVQSEDPGFSVLAPTPGCTEYYKGRGGRLDHAVVTGGLVQRGARLTVQGYCADLKCAPTRERELPAAYAQLSDHCPLVLEL